MESNIFETVSFMKQTFKCISYDKDSFVMDWNMEYKGFVPMHIHQYMDEDFTILSGEGKFVMDGKEIIAKKGDRIYIPKNVPHSVKTLSKADLVCRIVYYPCSDTHKMFAIFGGLKRDGYKGMKYLLRATYISEAAGLKRFSTAVGAGAVTETLFILVLKAIGKVRGWDKSTSRYLINIK